MPALYIGFRLDTDHVGREAHYRGQFRGRRRLQGTAHGEQPACEYHLVLLARRNTRDGAVRRSEGIGRRRDVEQCRLLQYSAACPTGGAGDLTMDEVVYYQG